jgi:hypothetical protein
VRDDHKWHQQLMTGESADIYSPDGFLAPWYFALRASEEAARSERYHNPLTLLALDVLPKAQSGIEVWLSAQMRSTDLVCRANAGQYFVLLVETDEANAWQIGQRLLADNPTISFTVATLSVDSARFDSLLFKLEQPADGWDKAAV